MEGIDTGRDAGRPRTRKGKAAAGGDGNNLQHELEGMAMGRDLTQNNTQEETNNRGVHGEGSRPKQTPMTVMEEEMGQMMANFPREMESAVRESLMTIRQDPVSRNNRGACRPLGFQTSDHLADTSGEESERTVRGFHNNHRQASKLPPFTGKEKWIVWFNRFSDVARLRRWTESQKLDELLPRLQGAAGEFVYEMLSQRTRSNFGLLVEELNNRFRVIETRKTFAAQFSNRNQRPNETHEEYAAELKRLYDKGHANRNLETRQEDLLRRFLDGLLDERVRFHVEYIKDPQSIDQAVDEVINFQETRRKPQFREGQFEGRNKRSTRRIEVDLETDSGEDEDRDATGQDTERIARIQGRGKKTPILRDTENSEVKDKRKETTVGKENSTSDEIHTALKEVTESLTKLTLTVESIDKRVSTLENGRTRQRPRLQGQQRSTNYRYYGSGNSPNQDNGTQNNFQPRGQQPNGLRICFSCGQEGHFARNCPNVPMVTGQMQLAVQPASVVDDKGMEVFAKERKASMPSSMEGSSQSN